MTTIASHATREEKQTWLLRPFDWALKIAAYAAVAGLVFWYEGKLRPGDLALTLVVVNAVVFGLLAWGVRRLMAVTRGGR